MTEFVVIAIVIAILVGLSTAARVLSPDMVILAMVWIVNLLNIPLFLGNVWQAFKHDPRFLNPYWLGIITVITGAGLFAFFGVFLGIDSRAFAAAIPISITGVVTLVVAVWSHARGARRKNRQESSDQSGDEAANSIQQP